MGFAFFEQDGTFNPADYGLKVGDMIAVVMIGGGGNAVNNGSESKFGDYLTAAGGLAAGSSSYAGDGGWHPSLPMTMCKALPNTYQSDTIVYSNAGGVITSSGGTPIIMYGGGVGQKVTQPTRPNSESSLPAQAFPIAYGTAGNWFGKGGKVTSAKGGAGSGYVAEAWAGGGGAGYGAGAAGGYSYVHTSNTPYSIAKNGGAAGELKSATFKLENMEEISITVGIGGLESNVANSSGYINSGAGENGCVAVYW